MRSSRVLLRLASAMAAPLVEHAPCIRLMAAEGLLRCLPTVGAAMPSGATAPLGAPTVQRRGYIDNSDQLGEPRDDWEYGHRTDHVLITDRSRDLEDYEELIGVLARRRRAYKIRDVFEEMDLNGVAPAAMTYFRAMFACMKARRLGDTLYYWERMLKAGVQPDARAYGVVISAAGRAGQTEEAVKLMNEMRAKGLMPTKNTYLAALNALAESSCTEDAWALVEEMKRHDIEPDEFAYTAIINGYKHAKPAPPNVEAKLDELLELCREVPTMEFSRRKEGGLGIISYNAALNTFCALGFHERVCSMFAAMPQESLIPDYDSYSALIVSYLKESLRAYRQFAASHPCSQAHLTLMDDSADGEEGTPDQTISSRPSSPVSKTQPAFADPVAQMELEEALKSSSMPIAEEYRHLDPGVGRHLTRLKARVNMEAWDKVIEIYDEAAHKGLSLSPNVYYDLMRTAVLVANTGHVEALGFAEHCLKEMTHLGMFLNTQNGSTILAACSRRELPAGLSFAHRLWDVLIMNGRVPKTNAIQSYLRALQARESQWVERIEQVKRVASIDPMRLRSRPVKERQKTGVEMARRKWAMSEKLAALKRHSFEVVQPGGIGGGGGGGTY